MLSLHLVFTVGDYDPLRSISLFLADGFGGQRSYDIRACSSWSAQLWVDGLTAANYVYQCMLQQNFACDGSPVIDETENGTSSHWFNRNRYLPDTIPSNHSSPLSSPTPLGRPLQRYWSSSQSSDSDTETIGTTSISSRQSGSVFSQTGYLSERSPSPPSPAASTTKVHHSLPSRYRRSRHVAIKPRRNRTIANMPGLPYVNSPLSSICRCHAFEIVPSRSVDLRSLEKRASPVRSCCVQCRDACKIAMDMDNL